MISLPPLGFRFPGDYFNNISMNATGLISSVYGYQTLDAANEGIDLIGRVFINGRPTSAKTISSAGGKLYAVLSGTFANAGTTLRFGVQDIETAGAAPPPRGDGTFDVYGDLVGGTDTLAGASAFTSVTMSSGSKSITHGDIIAIRLQAQSRGGTDAPTYKVWGLRGTPQGYPLTTTISSVPAYTAVGTLPVFWMLFDDGTVGWIENTFPYANVVEYDYITSASNPDEYGLIFTAPVTGWVDALYAHCGCPSADGTVLKLTLYSDPTGTPTALATGSLYGDELGQGAAVEVPFSVVLSTPVKVTKGARYCVAVRSTTTSGNILLYRPQFASDNEQIASGIFTVDMTRGTRDGETGAFTETARKPPFYGIRYCAIEEPGRATLALGV